MPKTELNERDLEFIKLRYFENLTLQGIADKYLLTRERVRQRINRIGEIISQKQIPEGEEKAANELSESLENLLKHFTMKDRHKAYRVVNYFGIKEAKEFLKLRPKDICLKGVGNKFFLELKLALFKIGISYDAEDQEQIGRKIIALVQRVSDGILKLRFGVFKRDGFRCKYCGRSPKSDSSVVLQVDHIKPVSSGGKTIEDNLITSCQECNLGKGDVLLNGRKAKDLCDRD